MLNFDSPVIAAAVLTAPLLFSDRAAVKFFWGTSSAGPQHEPHGLDLDLRGHEAHGRLVGGSRPGGVVAGADGVRSWGLTCQCRRSSSVCRVWGSRISECGLEFCCPKLDFGYHYGKFMR